MNGFHEYALVRDCEDAGTRSCRRLCRFAGLVMMIAVQSIFFSVRAAEPADSSSPFPSLPRQGLAIENPDRGDRSLLSLDPVAARWVAGIWTMPAKDESVNFKNGQVRRWQPVQATPDGTFNLAGRGSYLAIEITLDDERVLILEASGHVMVQVNGEPRGGDPYAHGYVHLPILLRKGPNVLLFQAGRDHRITARLRSPAALAVLDPADVTTPDLIVNEPVNTEASIIVINASQLWCDNLAIVSRLPGGDSVHTSVPALPPLSARKVGFRLTGPAPGNRETSQ